MRVFRPRPPEESGPDLYVPDPAGWGEELWRGVEMALVPVAPGERMWFDGGEESWEPWVEDEFGAAMAPGILRARRAAVAGVREWADADEAFGRGLGGGEGSARSLRAGRRIVMARDGARHFRGWEKLGRWLVERPEAGHGATVTAFLGAGFHVPPAACLVACLFDEWRAAFPGRGREAFLERTPELGRRLGRWLEREASFPALQSPGAEPE